MKTQLKNLAKVIVSGIVAALIFSSFAMAWGGRGHHTICEVAVHLVQDPELKAFLQVRPHIMGHLCNIPDISWKNIGPDVRKTGDPTHYINAENLGIALKDLPISYAKIIEDYTGKPDKENPGSTILSVPSELGSNWWRADQFMRRIAARREAFSKASLPAPGGKHEINDGLEYNKLIHETIVDLGVMGHYVGDNAQPFHTTSDYDGYDAGHGGIHGYYEDDIVGQYDGDLVGEILRKARAVAPFKEAQKFLTAATTVEKMKALGLISNAEVKAVYKLDPIIKKSELREEKGMQIKTMATRQPPEVGGRFLRPLVVKQMARASLLLAKLWDEAYVSLGNPPLRAFRSYKFPFTPQYIPPDYIGNSANP
jgi:hypothetical protein